MHELVNVVTDHFDARYKHEEWLHMLHTCMLHMLHMLHTCNCPVNISN